MSSKDLKTRFDSRFCRMNCQMTVSRLTDARASIWHSAQRRSRELSLWPEFGSISGNLCDLSEEFFVTSFLSSDLTCPATQSGLREPCPARVSLRDIPAAYGDGGGSLWRIFLVSRGRSSKLVLGGAGACVPSGNETAQRCPGGGRSPAPASVYNKVVPLKLAPWRARQAAT